MKRPRSPGMRDLDVTDQLHVQDAVMRGRAVHSARLASVAVQTARRTRRRLQLVMVGLLVVAVGLALLGTFAVDDPDASDLLRRLALFAALLALPFLYVLYVHRRAERQNARLLEDP